MGLHTSRTPPQIFPTTPPRGGVVPAPSQSLTKNFPLLDSSFRVGFPLTHTTNAPTGFPLLGLPAQPEGRGCAPVGAPDTEGGYFSYPPEFSEAMTQSRSASFSRNADHPLGEGSGPHSTEVPRPGFAHSEKIGKMSPIAENSPGELEPLWSAREGGNPRGWLSIMGRGNSQTPDATPALGKWELAEIGRTEGIRAEARGRANAGEPTPPGTELVGLTPLAEKGVQYLAGKGRSFLDYLRGGSGEKRRLSGPSGLLQKILRRVRREPRPS